ncbi:MAG: ABC transporter substrate-binding protein, partial [Phycisphaerae bacterium]
MRLGPRGVGAAAALTGHVVAIAVLATAPRDGAGTPARPSPPTRIITIAPNAAEIICALGACDRLVAVS